MNARTRIRKAIKWGGAVMCVVMAMVWVGSARVWRFWMSSDTSDRVAVASGVLIVDHGYSRQISSDWFWYAADYAGPRNVLDEWSDHNWKWNVELAIGQARPPARSNFQLTIPLWLPLLLTLIPTTIAWRRDARARRIAKSGLCASCGYDLAGLPSAQPCPECGKKNEPAA